MESPIAILSQPRDMASRVVAAGAKPAMVDDMRPVRGFGIQCPLAASGVRTGAIFLKGPPLFSSRRRSSSFFHGKSTKRALTVSASWGLGEFPGHEVVSAHVDLAQHLLTRLESSVFMLADATTASVDVEGAVNATQTAVKQGSDGWLGGLTDTLEKILIFLKDGLATLKVPYAYGFAIIMLTFLVKAATFPLTKSQVQSTIAMQNLQPKLKQIQSRYQGDQERIQLETARLYKSAGVNPLAGCLPTLATLPVWIGLYRALSNVANEGLLYEGFFWIPSLAGPTTIAARQGGSGVAWLFPFQDGAPPLGWSDTIAYLVLPVLLVGSQYVSMQIMQPPQTDPSQKTTQAILKFLPLMIGYFALSVPSGLSLYWLTNNVLSTAQQVWLRKDKVGAGPDPSTIISAGQAKRSAPAAPPASSALQEEPRSFKTDRRGEKFKELKAKEAKRKASKETSLKAQATQDDEPSASSEHASSSEFDSQDGTGEVIDVVNEGDDLEVVANGAGGSKSKKGKRSKRTRGD